MVPVGKVRGQKVKIFMLLNTNDAPATGGYEPGGRIFARDGDYTQQLPFGPPVIYNPMPGDSIPSPFPIALLDRTLVPPDYSLLPIGTGFNVQNFAPSQAALIIEQEFDVLEAYYVPWPLNTPYNPTWGLGWQNTYLGLDKCFLVEEGPLDPQPGGIIRVKRKFASLPPNRNEYESFYAQYPPILYALTDAREGFSTIVNSRLFFEYFVYDNLNLLPDIALFPAGHRINTDVLGANSKFLEFEEFKVFQGLPSKILAINRNAVITADQKLQDAGTGTAATTPDWTTYADWMDAVEIIVEASSFNRWLGNIHVRKTRFALAR